MTGLEVQNSVAGSLFRSGFRSMFHVFDKKYKFFSVTVIRMIDGVVMRIVGKLDAYFYQQPWRKLFSLTLPVCFSENAKIWRGRSIWGLNFGIVLSDPSANPISLPSGRFEVSASDERERVLSITEWAHSFNVTDRQTDEQTVRIKEGRKCSWRVSTTAFYRLQSLKTVASRSLDNF